MHDDYSQSKSLDLYELIESLYIIILGKYNHLNDVRLFSWYHDKDSEQKFTHWVV